MLMESKHYAETNISQKQMKDDFFERKKKELGKWYLVPVLGKKVTMLSKRDMSKLWRAKLGTVPLFMLNVDNKSKCFDFRELQKASEPKVKC